MGNLAASFWTDSMAENQYVLFSIYLLPFALVWIFYAIYRELKYRRYEAIRDSNYLAGLTEPASLHPLIDHRACIGCGSCVSACPEHQVLAVIRRKSELINPANCIGHGACKMACPVDAISLVFGSERRGIDIPNLSPEFETNVGGIYIAGELGGMGLVRNAAEQGKQAISAIKKTLSAQSKAEYDVIIVGAGPAGIAAALTARADKLKYRVLEQDSLGGTVSHFPRNKIVMTSPVKLPLVGKMQFREERKEVLLEYWEKIVDEHKLNIAFGSRLDDIKRQHDYFDIASSGQEYTAQRVLLCLGRRGTPRKLGVPGEEQGKVVYRLIDPEQFKGQHVLVVGGGDSALEAALSLMLVEGTNISLAYRGSAFQRAKQKNRTKVDDAMESNTMTVLLDSQVKEIGENDVSIDTKNGPIDIKNDAVIVCAGGILPTPFLAKIGIQIETKYGTA